MPAYRIPDHHAHDHEELDALGEGVTFPDAAALRAYHRLVGLDEIKDALLRDSLAMLRADSLTEWSHRNYGRQLPALEVMAGLRPMFVFAGDVGTGKTALARSFGSRLAEVTGGQVRLHQVSFRVRGTGMVGEMTALIEQAFRAFRTLAERDSTVARILLVDEADTLAQSRNLGQMHHEDRAGVNALIREIDAIGGDCPLVVVLCTNRLDALDPAVVRRARRVFRFVRPDAQQRRALFSGLLDGSGLEDADLDAIAAACDGMDGAGFTYSDIATRVLPEALLRVWPDDRLTTEAIIAVIRQTAPAPTLLAPTG